MVIPGPSVHSHLLIYLFELNSEKWGAMGNGCFTPPSCIPGFWLLQTFLTETKCLFVVYKA